MAKWLDAISRSICDDILMNIHNYDYMKSLMDIMGPNHQIFKKNMTIMHFSVYSNDIRIVILVLESGGDPNLKDINGITPTDLCVILKRPIDYLNLLLSYGGKKSIFCYDI